MEARMSLFRLNEKSKLKAAFQKEQTGVNMKEWPRRRKKPKKREQEASENNAPSTVSNDLKILNAEYHNKQMNENDYRNGTKEKGNEEGDLN